MGKRSLLVDPIYDHIKAHPGCKVYQIAEAIDRPRGIVANALANLEGNGLLVAEDGEGRLYPFPFEGVGDE